MSVTINASDGSTELNVANGNFSDLWRFLGLPVDWCGEISGPRLRRAVFARRERREELLAPTMQDGNVFECGRDADQVDRYFEALEQIAAEAIVSKSPVGWS